MRIGVLALQGDFAEHMALIRRLGVEAQKVRLPQQLAGLDGLIIPGGESTTIGKLVLGYGLQQPLREMGHAGQPIWGTCAGMILLAREAVDGHPGQPLMGMMDIVVRRNAFGRQVDSFEADLDVPVLGPPPFRGIFIRAPAVESWGPDVEVLAQLENGTVVAVRQGPFLGTAFHPELTQDDRFHRYFLRIVEQATGC